MNKKEALTLYMKVHDECLTHKCKDCAFREPFNGMGACIMDHINSYGVAMSIKEMLKRIDEKQEAKPSPASPEPWRSNGAETLGRNLKCHA